MTSGGTRRPSRRPLFQNLPMLLKDLKNFNLDDGDFWELHTCYRHYSDSLCAMLQSGEELNLDEVTQAVDLLRVFTCHLFTKIDCLESQVNNLQSEVEVLKDGQVQLEKLEADLLVGEIQ